MVHEKYDLRMISHPAFGAIAGAIKYTTVITGASLLLDGSIYENLGGLAFIGIAYISMETLQWDANRTLSGLDKKVEEFDKKKEALDKQ